MTNLKQNYIYSVKLALKQELENVIIRTEGNLVLFNASTKATYDGHITMIRGLSPRINKPFLHIIISNCVGLINCLEITEADINKMD